MNRCTLLIDGNWLLLSRFSTMQKYFLKTNTKEEKILGQQQLCDLMMRSITIVLNRFSDVIDNIVLVTDGGSWRKKLVPPKDNENAVYKGNRKPTESEFDYEYIFNTLNNLRDIFNNNNITVSNTANCEGDDYIYYWSRFLNNKNINTVIWSTDNDLKQLVQLKNGVFTAWYNDKNGLFLPIDLQEDDYDEVEFFLHQEKNNIYTKSLKANSKSCNYINPFDIISKKIIGGDASDNIRSIIQIKKNNRVYKISDKDIEKCFKKLNITNLNELFNRKVDVCWDLKVSKNSDDNIEDIIKRFEYNRQLVYLNDTEIPNEILESMSNNSEYKEFDISIIRRNYKSLFDTDKDIENLFDSIMGEINFE